LPPSSKTACSKMAAPSKITLSELGLVHILIQLFPLPSIHTHINAMIPQTLRQPIPHHIIQPIQSPSHHFQTRPMFQYPIHLLLAHPLM